MAGEGEACAAVVLHRGRRYRRAHGRTGRDGSVEKPREKQDLGRASKPCTLRGTHH